MVRLIKTEQPKVAIQEMGYQILHIKMRLLYRVFQAVLCLFSYTVHASQFLFMIKLSKINLVM